MKLHAYRRNPNESIDVDFGGQMLKFKPNERGDVVADVEPEELALALVQAAPCGYRAYETAQALAPKPPAPAPKPTKAEPAPTASTSPSDASGDQAQQGKPAEQAQASAFVITSPEGESFDLGAMDDDGVRAFAVKQGLEKPHHSKKGDKLRAFVIEELKKGD